MVFLNNCKFFICVTGLILGKYKLTYLLPYSNKFLKLYIWQKVLIALSSELKSPNRRTLSHTLMNVNQCLYWYILNIPWSLFYGDYSYKLFAIFVSWDLIRLKRILYHGQYMKKLLISKGYLPWRIELYLLLCYSCQACMVLSKISCKIARLGMKNRVLFLKSSVNQLHLEPFQRQVQTCFLESWCWYDQLYLSLFEFFNLKGTLMQIWKSANIFVFIWK